MCKNRYILVLHSEANEGEIKMKKVFLSLLGGLIIGGIISYIFLDYQNSNYQIQNYYGATKKEVKEWDFEFLFNATGIALATSMIIYLLWTFFEKWKKSKNT
jgi:Na+-driven multidrug efflux pump